MRRVVARPLMRGVRSVKTSRLQLMMIILPLAVLHLRCGSGHSNPVAASTPTPTAAPTPEPAATPFVCPLGKGTGSGENCPMNHKADPFLFEAMKNAVLAVEGEHPEL